MLYKFEYKDLEERELIVSQNTDKYLIEEQNIIDGNFLIFSNEKPKPIEIIPTPEELLNTEVKELKARLDSTEDALLELILKGWL